MYEVLQNQELASWRKVLLEMDELESMGIQQDLNKWFGGVLEVSGSYGSKYLNLGSSGNVSFSARTKMQA